MLAVSVGLVSGCREASQNWVDGPGQHSVQAAHHGNGLRAGALSVAGLACSVL